MKNTPFMEMVEAATNEFKNFYSKYYARKQYVYGQYRDILGNFEHAIQEFTEGLKKTEGDRLHRLVEVYEDFLEKRRREWAEYELDFDALWEKQAPMRAKYPRHQCDLHPIFKPLYGLRSANTCPQDAMVIINGLQTELKRAVTEMETELTRAVKHGRFKKEKNILPAIILYNPSAAQILLNPSEYPSKDSSWEQHKMKIILSLGEQIERLNHSWWNPFLPNKVLLANKQAVLYQLIHEFYDTANVGKTVEDVFNKWLSTTTVFEKKPTSYQALLGYHRNVFFQRHRPGVQTNSEELINQLKTQYGRMTL